MKATELKRKVNEYFATITPKQLERNFKKAKYDVFKKITVSLFNDMDYFLVDTLASQAQQREVFSGISVGKATSVTDDLVTTVGSSSSISFIFVEGTFGTTSTGYEKSNLRGVLL